jgi:hypothetical protein
MTTIPHELRAAYTGPFLLVHLFGLHICDKASCREKPLEAPASILPAVEGPITRGTGMSYRGAPTANRARRAMAKADGCLPRLSRTMVTAGGRPPVGDVALPGTRPAGTSRSPESRLDQGSTNVCSNQEDFTAALHMCSNYLHVSGKPWPLARIR